MSFVKYMYYLSVIKWKTFVLKTISGSSFSPKISRKVSNNFNSSFPTRLLIKIRLLKSWLIIFSGEQAGLITGNNLAATFLWRNRVLVRSQETSRRFNGRFSRIKRKFGLSSFETRSGLSN